MVRAMNGFSSLTIGLALACTTSSLLADDLKTEKPASNSPRTVDYVVELPADEGPEEPSALSTEDDFPAAESAAQPLESSGFDDAYDVEYDTTVEESKGEETPPEDAAQSKTEDDVELIKDRFPSGALRIERQVTQDARGNYLNHGSWKEWDERGNLLAQGQYEYGNRTGVWIRWYRNVREATVLAKLPYTQYAGPFISQATFKNDQLDGFWTIYDGKTNKISQWTFNNGKRDGASIWWYANGKKMREAQFVNGDMDGEYHEWAPDGSLRVKETYQEGRKLAVKTSYYNAKAKKSEGVYLHAKDVEHTPDDWWTCTLLKTVKTGKDEKHGPWTGWFANGAPQLEGAYEHDLKVGQFTWWHSNGQRALQGSFDRGKQNGKWTWWHANGQKSIEGEYALGNPSGRWTWWKEDGQVVQSADLSQSEGVVIETPRQLETPIAPPAFPQPHANTARRVPNTLRAPAAR